MSLPKLYLKEMLAEPFKAFVFSPVGASVYQLGSFGAARKKLQALSLTPLSMRTALARRRTSAIPNGWQRSALRERASQLGGLFHARRQLVDGTARLARQNAGRGVVVMRICLRATEPRAGEPV